VKIFCFPYETKYFEKAGILGSHIYEDILINKGQPFLDQVVKNEKNYSTRSVYYDGYIFNFLKGKMDLNPGEIKVFDVEKGREINIHKSDRGSGYVLQNSIITDPNYKLGIFRIGIGSSKNMVKLAYMGAKRQVDEENGYIDGVTWIDFTFDKNNKVKQIQIYNGP
jgi:hypothetical protein